MATCNECDCCYCEDIPEDVAFHNSRHDKVINGLPCKRANSENVVWEVGQDYITIVTPHSEERQRVNAQEVALLAGFDMKYDFTAFAAYEPLNRPVRAFLYHSKDRIVGFACFRLREKAWHCSWEEYERREKNLVEYKTPIWSVTRLWVHRKERRRGVARLLLGAALLELRRQITSIAWETPFTIDAEKFLRGIYSEPLLIN